MEVLLASMNTLYMLRTCLPGVKFELCDVAIQNIVGNTDLHLKAGEKLDLNAFYQDHNVYCTYQPNMFPGLIYRPVHINLVILLFFSGRLVLTGALGCTMKCVYECWDALFPLIKTYKRRAEADPAHITACQRAEILNFRPPARST
jgi:transcription initiation factor TFIID TATA-box-binding protein